MRKLLDKIKPNFEEGGKLERWYPVYDSLDTFLYTPGHSTHSGSHIRDGVDLKRTMFMVIIALIPATLFGMWNIGYQHALSTGIEASLMDNFIFGLIKVLPIIVVSYAVGLGVEFTFCIIKKHAIQEGFLVSGLLIPLIMPVETPLWMVAVGTVFAVLIAKEVFGGTGMNIVNVALTARAFLFFAYPTKLSGSEVWVSEKADGYSGATALGDLAGTIDMKIEKGRQVVDSMFYAVDAKYSLFNSFFGLIPGSIGETSAFAILIGAAILLFTGVASWRIILSFFVGGFVMASLFNLWGANAFMEVEAIHQLMLGGFMFGMVFMATDPVTASQTNTGKIIYGFLGGFLAILIRVFNPAYPEGVMLAILFVNVMAPLIDHYVINANVKRRLKRVKTA